MTGLMAHRGPDGAGLWQASDGHVVLGHRRLAILDLSEGGHQPMVRDGLVLVFNGEIYNYLELRAELAALGETFLTDTDSEILLAAYQRWGEDCLARLNGMFAFAILDHARNRLFCARDRFGEKPFLFHAGAEMFAFASEYKALLALDGIGREIDDVALARFLHDPAMGTDDGRVTLFAGISQLLPGECMSVDLARLDYRIARYWQPRLDVQMAEWSIPRAAEHFRDLLTQSVGLRLRSDVPVGSCLSGGLDSGAIVCLARSLIGAEAPYHVFTGRFPGTPADEWERARHVAEQAGVIVHSVSPQVETFLADLPEFLWANELPVGSSSQYAQYCVFRLAAQNGVTVLLDGQGADEILGGYEQYFAAYLASLPASQRTAEAARIQQRYPGALPCRRQRFSRALPMGARHILASLSGRGSETLFGMRRDLALAAMAGGREAANTNNRAASPLGRALAADALAAHLPVLLRYGDRNSMAHSREVRLPFCDHRLIEAALSASPGHLMGDGQTKRLLREAMRGVLPEPVRSHWRKQGFLPPQVLWFRTHLANEFEAMVEDPSFQASGLWREGWWRSALARFRAGDDHLAWTLWRPFMVESWRRHFLQRVRAMAPEAVFAER